MLQFASTGLARGFGNLRGYFPRLRHGGLMLVYLILLQQVSSQAAVPEGCDERMDVAFILDASESIVENDPYGEPYFYWELMKNYTASVIENLPLADSKTDIALMKYSQFPEMVFDFRHSMDVFSLQQTVMAARHVGRNTRTSEALRFAQGEVFGQRYQPRIDIARKILIILSDGLSNRDVSRTKEFADAAKQDGLIIFTVAISKYTDDSELKTIASHPPDKHFIEVRDYRYLDYLVSLLVNRLCNLPDPTPPPPQCDVKSDLVFLLDNSGSIRDKNPKDGSYDNYQVLKEFVISLVDILDVGPEDNQIAAIRFSNFVKLEFYLNDFPDKAAVSEALNSTEYDGSETNIQGALKMAREEIFTKEHGDRQNIRNVAIIITDGESNIDPNRTIPEALLAKKAGITLFVIGVTNKINETELKKIASEPVDEHYFNTTDILSLISIKDQLIKEVCSNADVYRTRRSVKCSDEMCSSHEELPTGENGAQLGWISTVLIPENQVLELSFLAVFSLLAVLILFRVSKSSPDLSHPPKDRT